MIDLDDLNYHSLFDHREEFKEKYVPKMEEEVPPEVDDPMETQLSVNAPSRSSTHNYCLEEYVVLCDPWVNVSLDASTGTTQSKDQFWDRIEE